jgi:hypothetical protein
MSSGDGPPRKRRVIRRRRKRAPRDTEGAELFEFAKFEEILSHGPTMDD